MSWPEPVILDLSTQGRLGLNALYTACPLIIDGKRQPIWYHDRNALTTIGADPNGKIYLIVASETTVLFDSIGLTYTELRDIAEHFGLNNFVAMDGGWRSTSMVIEGKIIGEPDMQIQDEERRVGDHILIIDEGADLGGHYRYEKM